MPRYNYPPDLPEFYRPRKMSVENQEKLKEISDILTTDNCVKAITLPGGKMDAPSENVEQIFGGQYFTQIEIIGGQRDGVFLHSGIYKPKSPAFEYCNFFHYEDCNFGKDGEKPYWQKYIQGN